MMPCLNIHTTRRSAGRVLRDETGSVAVMFGLVATLLFACAGFAMDYSRAVRVQRLMQEQLDAAALAAVREETIDRATARFKAYLAAQPVREISGVAIAGVIESFDGVTLRASAQVQLPMTLAAAVGVPAMEVSVQSTAIRGSGYEDFYFAVDLSGSMGVGATAADRRALEVLTQPYTAPSYGALLPQGCAFGCHGREGWEPSGKTVYQMAREAGIRLREDELAAEFAAFVDALLDPADAAVRNGMRRVSVVGFSAYARQLLTPTTSPESAKSALARFPYGDRYDTNYANTFSELEYLLGSQGDGTQTRPRKTLVVITDGVKSQAAFFAQSAMDTDLCTTIKNKGFRLAVIELKYPKMVGNRLYDDTVLPVETQITPAMQACASPGWYFMASDNHEIPQKFMELKDQLTNSHTRIAR